MKQKSKVLYHFLGILYVFLIPFILMIYYNMQIDYYENNGSITIQDIPSFIVFLICLLS